MHPTVVTNVKQLTGQDIKTYVLYLVKEIMS